MARTLIIIGVIFVAAGALWPWLGRLPLGHLPGDIVIRRKNFSVYFPVTTTVLASIAISFLLWFLKR